MHNHRLLKLRYLICLSLPSFPIYGNDGSMKSIISSRALSDVSGSAAVNAAAGDFNQQANAVVIAVNPRGRSYADIHILQRGQRGRSHYPSQSTAVIGGHAFANASGLVTVNQASGMDNAQANSIAIGIGVEGQVTADSVLEQTLPDMPAGSAPDISRGNRTVRINDTAFKGSSGVIQVNQAAGSGNATTNSFGLTIQLGRF